MESSRVKALSNLLADRWILRTSLEGTGLGEVLKEVFLALEKIDSRTTSQILGLKEDLLALQKLHQACMSESRLLKIEESRIESFCLHLKKEFEKMLTEKQRKKAIWIPFYPNSNENHIAIGMLVRSKEREKIDFIYINTGSTDLTLPIDARGNKKKTFPFVIKDIDFSDHGKIRNIFRKIAEINLRNFYKIHPKSTEKAMLEILSKDFMEMGGKFSRIEEPFEAQSSGTCVGRSLLKSIKNFLKEDGVKIVSELKLIWLEQLAEQAEHQHKLLHQLVENMERRIQKNIKRGILSEEEAAQKKEKCVLIRQKIKTGEYPPSMRENSSSYKLFIDSRNIKPSSSKESSFFIKKIFNLKNKYFLRDLEEDDLNNENIDFFENVVLSIRFEDLQAENIEMNFYKIIKLAKRYQKTKNDESAKTYLVTRKLLCLAEALFFSEEPGKTVFFKKEMLSKDLHGNEILFHRSLNELIHYEENFKKSLQTNVLWLSKKAETLSEDEKNYLLRFQGERTGLEWNLARFFFLFIENKIKDNPASYPRLFKDAEKLKIFLEIFIPNENIENKIRFFEKNFYESTGEILAIYDFKHPFIFPLKKTLLKNITHEIEFFYSLHGEMAARVLSPQSKEVSSKTKEQDLTTQTLSLIHSGKAGFCAAIGLLSREDFQEHWKSSDEIQVIFRKSFLSYELFYTELTNPDRKNHSAKLLTLELSKIFSKNFEDALKSHENIAASVAAVLDLYLDLLNLLFEAKENPSPSETNLDVFWNEFLEELHKTKQKVLDLYHQNIFDDLQACFIKFLFFVSVYLKNTDDIFNYGTCYSLLSENEKEQELSLRERMLEKYLEILNLKNLESKIEVDFLIVFLKNNFNLKEISRLEIKDKIIYIMGEKEYFIDLCLGALIEKKPGEKDKNPCLKIPHSLENSKSFKAIKKFLGTPVIWEAEKEKFITKQWVFYFHKGQWRAFYKKNLEINYLFFREDLHNHENIYNYPVFFRNLPFYFLSQTYNLLVIKEDCLLNDFVVDYEVSLENGNIFIPGPGPSKKAYFSVPFWELEIFKGLKKEKNIFYKKDSQEIYFYFCDAHFKFINDQWRLQKIFSKIDIREDWFLISQENQLLDSGFLFYWFLQNSKGEKIILVPQGSYYEEDITDKEQSPGQVLSYFIFQSSSSEPYCFKCDGDFLFPENEEGFVFLMQTFLMSWNFKAALVLLEIFDRSFFSISSRSLDKIFSFVCNLNPIVVAFFCKILCKTRSLQQEDMFLSDILSRYYQAIGDIPEQYRLTPKEEAYLSSLVYCFSEKDTPICILEDLSKTQAFSLFEKRVNTLPFFSELLEKTKTRAVPEILAKEDSENVTLINSISKHKESIFKVPFVKAIDFSFEKPSFSVLEHQLKVLEKAGLFLENTDAGSEIESESEEIFSFFETSENEKHAVQREKRLLTEIKLMKNQLTENNLKNLSKILSETSSEKKSFLEKVQQEIESFLHKPLEDFLESRLAKSYALESIESTICSFFKEKSPKDISEFNKNLGNYFACKVFLRWLERLESCFSSEIFDTDRITRLLLDKNTVFEENGPQEPWWMIFQYSQNIIIRPYQEKLAREACENLLSKEPGKAYQCLMGKGKTSTILPLMILLLNKMNQENKLVLIVLPETLLSAQLELIRKSVQKTSDVEVLDFHFHRNSTANLHGDAKKNYFLQLLKRMLYAQENRSVVLTDPYSIFSLQAYFQEISIKKEEGSLGIVVYEILKLLREESLLFFDELDSFLPSKTMLNYSIGRTSKIDETYVFWTSLLFEFIFDVPDLKKSFLSSIQSFEKRKKIIFFNSMKKKLLEDPKSPLWIFSRGDQVVFSKIQRYFQENISFENLGFTASQKKSAAFLKSLLDYFYAAFVQAEGYGYSFALYDQKIVPCHQGKRIEKAKFEDPIFEMLCFFLAYFQVSLPENIIRKELSSLVLKAKKTSLELGISYEETFEFQAYKKRTGKDLLKPGKQIPDTLIIELSKNYLWIVQTIAHQIAPQIVFEERRIVVDTTQLQASHSSGFSGTLECLGKTLPPGIEVSKEHLFADRIFLEKLREKETKIIKISSENNLSIRQVLLSFFELTYDNNLEALVDAEGWFCGFSNQIVAECIAGILLEKRNPKKFVVFFDSSGAKKYIRVSDKTKLNSLGSVKTQDLFVFYGLVNARGFDFPLSFNATIAVTCGSRMTLTQLSQSVARARLFLEGEQKVLLLVSEEFPETLQEIIHLCHENEANKLASEAFLMTKNKIKQIFLQAFFDAISNISDEALLRTKTEEFFSLFLEGTSSFDAEIRGLEVESIPSSEFFQRCYEFFLKKFSCFFKSYEELNNKFKEIQEGFKSSRKVLVYKNTCFVSEISSQEVFSQQQQQQQTQAVSKTDPKFLSESVLIESLDPKNCMEPKEWISLKEIIPDVGFSEDLFITKKFFYSFKTTGFFSVYTPRVLAILIFKHHEKTKFMGLSARQLEAFKPETFPMDSFSLEMLDGKRIVFEKNMSWVDLELMKDVRAQFYLLGGDFNSLSSCDSSWIEKNHASILRTAEKLSVPFPSFRDNLAYFSGEFFLRKALKMVFLEQNDEEILSFLNFSQKEILSSFASFFEEAKKHYAETGKVLLTLKEKNPFLASVPEKYIFRAISFYSDLCKRFFEALRKKDFLLDFEENTTLFDHKKIIENALLSLNETQAQNLVAAGFDVFEAIFRKNLTLYPNFSSFETILIFKNGNSACKLLKK